MERRGQTSFKDMGPDKWAMLLWIVTCQKVYRAMQFVLERFAEEATIIKKLT